MNRRKSTNHQTARQQKELLQKFEMIGIKSEKSDRADISTMEISQQTDGLTPEIVDFDKEVADLYPWLLRLAKRYCSSHEDAEDLAGDTICKVLDHRDKFQKDKPLKPWCCAVLANTYFTKFKKNLLISFVSYDSVVDMRSAFNPFNNLCYNEIVSAIQRCTKRTKCMNCLLLYTQGFSHEEISLSLDIPIGTVRSRISFSRKALALELNLKL